MKNSKLERERGKKRYRDRYYYEYYLVFFRILKMGTFVCHKCYRGGQRQGLERGGV